MKRGRLTREYERLTPRTVWQRARQLGLDPLLETPFGALAVEGHFPDYILNTVAKMNEIYLDWYGEIDLKPWPVSPSFEVGSGRSPVHENDHERAELAKRSYERLCNELQRFPKSLREALWELCICKRAKPADVSLDQIRVALEAMAAALGYKALKKRLDKSRRVPD